ncbi:MAG: hypothetical protein HYV03_00695 [Deltaproteobacteria bacterium]|nr:hypothetical protein [Deltaproteobacteria bacterium]
MAPTHADGLLRRLARFRCGGVAIDGHKEATASLSIEPFCPPEVVLPLVQHAGPPARALVKRKTHVTRGECIAEAADGGAPVHASVSGTVERIALQPHPTLTEAPAIVITTDPQAIEPVWEEVPGWQGLSTEQMLAAIAAAGIVGLGGAAGRSASLTSQAIIG